MNRREEILNALKSLDIGYEITEHAAVFTIEQMEALGVTDLGDVCKNLFLRDAKGARHFLVVLLKDKKADLKKIQEQLGCTKLSFASEERLLKHLGLGKGEVTPLAVDHGGAAGVEVVFDRDLTGKNRLGVHPGDNRATVWISFGGLEKYVAHYGRQTRAIAI